jgi:hypothetical protein
VFRGGWGGRIWVKKSSNGRQTRTEEMDGGVKVTEFLVLFHWIIFFTENNANHGRTAGMDVHKITLTTPNVNTNVS